MKCTHIYMNLAMDCRENTLVYAKSIHFIYCVPPNRSPHLEGNGVFIKPYRVFYGGGITHNPLLVIGLRENKRFEGGSEGEQGRRCNSSLPFNWERFLLQPLPWQQRAIWIVEYHEGTVLCIAGSDKCSGNGSGFSCATSLLGSGALRSILVYLPG